MPVALVCSDEFGPLARAEAQVLGLGDLPLIAVPHPLAGNDATLVAAKAGGIAAQVAAALTLPASDVGARFGRSFTHLTARRLAHGQVCVDAVCVTDPALDTDPGAG